MSTSCMWELSQPLSPYQPGHEVEGLLDCGTCKAILCSMNSFREKLGLRLSDPASSDPGKTTATHTNMGQDLIEVVSGADPQKDYQSCYFEGRKARADTADTETSFQATKNYLREELRLEDIGSHDDDEFVIYCADSLLSMSDDERDPAGTDARNTLTLSPLDMDRVFAEADTMLALHVADTSTSISPAGKQQKKRTNGRTNATRVKGLGFFSSNLLAVSGTRKPDFFSRKNKRNTWSSSNAARSRNFFSVSKVPASIAEESCSTPSSTSASVAPSP